MSWTETWSGLSFSVPVLQGFSWERPVGAATWKWTRRSITGKACAQGEGEGEWIIDYLVSTGTNDKNLYLLLLKACLFRSGRPRHKRNSLVAAAQSMGPFFLEGRLGGWLRDLDVRVTGHADASWSFGWCILDIIWRCPQVSLLKIDSGFFTPETIRCNRWKEWFALIVCLQVFWLYWHL